jgi:hypothetical protein
MNGPAPSRKPLHLLGALLLVVACERPATDDRSATQQPPQAASTRPQTIQDTLMVEGMPEVVESRLAESPEAGFSTYVPPGITMEVLTTGDSASVRFSASFAGPADRNAYMHVRTYPPHAGVGTVRENVATFLRTLRPHDDPVGGMVRGTEPHEQAEPPPWGEEAHTFAYTGETNIRYTGRVVLARSTSGFFHVITHYPPEFGDGLEPRFERILRHWRWETTGEMLWPGSEPTAPGSEPTAPDTGTAAPGSETAAPAPRTGAPARTPGS